MRLRYFQIDAFATRPFSGNPAGVCPLEKWLPENVLQDIAAENNLPETAFFLPIDGGFHLRWFTPLVEVDLCGHATLATAHALFDELGFEGESVRFQTRSGRLTATRIEGRIELDFPAVPGIEVAIPEDLANALGKRPDRVIKATDYMAVFQSQSVVTELAPDMRQLANLDSRGVIVTAPGDDADFVSRFFAPAKGIPEDPVTGSAHCTLTPYWTGRIGKELLHAKQVSKRGGELLCRLDGDRVRISGHAVTYSRAEIEVG